MSVTSGFYNSLNGDRKYNTNEISRIFDGIIRDGIFATIGTAFIVKADTGNRVTVGIGRAWFDHTWTYNDSILPITLDNSDILKNRIDAVVLETNNTDDVRENTIKVVYGEAKETPERPTLIKEEKVKQYALAYIYRGADTSVIKQENITNMVGTEETPFVTGIIETINAEELLLQWDSSFNTWFNDVKNQLTDSVAGGLLNQINTHTHDDRYYTETEVDNLLSSHKHNSENITYDNTESGLKAKNTQDAIDEICKSSYAFFLNAKEYDSYKSMTNLSYGFGNGSVVEYNSEIHLLGGNSSDTTNHYKYDESNDTWTKVSTLPYSFYIGSVVVLNNEIHILGGYNNSTKHYKWNGSSWVSVSTLPYSFYRGCAVIYNNEIHILGSSDSGTSHYKWNGSSWTKVSTLLSTFRQFCAVIYNNEIHILGGATFTKAHYKWNGSSWTEVGVLPYDFCDGCAIAINDKIHILGSSISGHYQKHYVYANSVWTAKRVLPYSFYNGSAVLHKGYIHLLGGQYNDTSYLHYKLKSGTFVNGYVKANTKIYLPYETYPMTDDLEVTTDGYKVTEDGLVEIFVG